MRAATPLISGTASGVAAFKQLCADRGIAARLVDLPVSGAFHTPFMAPAAEKFAPVLGAVSFEKPVIPAYANLTGGLYPDDPGAYAGILAAQIKSPVRWVDEIRAMNRRMNIPTGFDFIQEKDIPQMITWALAEANPVYPVPVVYDKKRCERVNRRIIAEA